MEESKLTKKGKPRKELSQEALDKLAQARAKANAIRKEGAIKKMEAKVEAHRGKAQDIEKEETEKDIGGNDVPVSGPDYEPEGVFDKVKEKLINPPKDEEEQEEPEVKVVKKKSTKKKPVVIIEQSSSDDEEFEDKKNIIFVKRASRKKKETVVAPPEPQLASSAPPEPPPQPPRPPPLSREQARLKQTYDSMFNGGFLGNRFY
jgi:hypothetical protein|tara:strand:+ start:1948 stop:2559 length:612 start_codon:yes stop_codon:yes gene_type:complete